MQKVKNFSKKKLIDLLSKSRLLENLSEDAITKFSQIGIIRSFDKNETIFRQNELATELYIILEGEVEISLEKFSEDLVEKHLYTPKLINTLQSGDVFGELAVQLQMKRSASAKSKGSILFICSRENLHDFCVNNSLIGLMIFFNLSRLIAAIVLENNKIILEHYIARHVASLFRKILIERDLGKNLITPSEDDIEIEEASSFLLAFSPPFKDEQVIRERLRITVFADYTALSHLMGEDEPNFGKIIAVLLKCIRTNTPIDTPSIAAKVSDNTEFRKGILKIKKKNVAYPIFLAWHIKGTFFEKNSGTLKGNIHLTIYSNILSPTMALENYLSYIKMPIQEKIIHFLNGSKKQHDIGIIVVHHRTLEIANTLHNLKRLGLTIEGYIGIPYGNIDPRLTHLLNHVSDYKYYTLRAKNYHNKKSEYYFDFYNSSHFSNPTEKEIRELFDSVSEKSYFNSMIVLTGYVLKKTIERSLRTKRPFVILEDGGYVLPLIYEAYYHPFNPMHELVVQAMKEKLILGVVEGTTSGEVRDLSCLKQFNEEEQKLLPILSGARDSIKTTFESKGIASSILHSAEVALRNLGLHGFEARKVLVLGGNGVIGTRIVEQLAQHQNTNSNLYNIDIEKQVHRFNIPEVFKTIHQHSIDHGIKRLQITSEDIVITDLNDRLFEKLNEKTRVIIANCFDVNKNDLSQLVAKKGYRLLKKGKHEHSKEFVLRKKDKKFMVSLMSPSTIISFGSIGEALQHDVDTIIGVTGKSVFDESDLDMFLFRKPRHKHTDELVLVSGSSKDTEFKKALLLLNELMIPAQLTTNEHVVFSLNYFKELHSRNLTLFSNPFFEEFFSANDFNSMDIYTQLSRYGQLKEKISQKIQINKEITTDVGSVYYIEMDGIKKRIILLADGLVINFFATYAKGASLDYIDPIVSLQLLGIYHLTKKSTAGGFHRISEELPTRLLEILWSSLEDQLKN